MEILAELRDGRLSANSEMYAKVEQLLDDTDLVKFAKMVIDVDQSRVMLDQTYGVVHATTPRPVANPETGAGAPAQSDGDEVEQDADDKPAGGADA